MKGGGKRERTTNRSTGRASSSKRSSPARSGGASSGASNGAGGNAEHPTVALAQKLAAIVESHSLTELVMDTPDLTLTFRRGQASEWGGGGSMQVPMPMAPPSLSHAASPPPQLAAPHAAAPAAPAAAAEPDYHLVTSPFVGTFYRSPGPDADPYVSEGQRVEKGQVLCIVEAMKLMNEIEADKAGVIAEILVQNAQPVEYGQALFKISPA